MAGEIRVPGLLGAMALSFVCGCSNHAPGLLLDGDASAFPQETDEETDFTSTEIEPDSDSLTVDTSQESLPMVWLVPHEAEETLPCANRRIPFTFSPDQTEYSDENAFWMMWASVRSFYSERPRTVAEFESIDFHRYQFFDHPTTGLQAFVAGGRAAVVVAFRGSIEVVDWLADLDLALRDGDSVDQPGKVHRGISRVLEASWAELEATVADFAGEGQPVWITGHSLGGAIATLVASRLVKLGYSVAPLYTFAAPRVGDRTYAEEAWKLFEKRHYRFVNGSDLVPRLPPSAKAAPYAGDLFPKGLLNRTLRELFVFLDYSHSGDMFVIGQESELVHYPALDEMEDVVYWSSLADEVDVRGIIGFIEGLEQGTLHNERTYICKLKEIYWGSD